MSCPPNYDFFKNIETYIKEEKKIVNSTPSTKVPDDCDKFSNLHRLGNQEKAKSLCISFAKLNQFLVALQTQNDDKCNFLNYWFNSELSQTWFSKNDSISDVYVGMESYLYTNDEYVPLNCELCNMNKVELNKMKILYNLHDKRNEMHDILNSQEIFEASKLHEPSAECFTNYNKGLSMCNNKEEKFCKLLENFKTEYRKLYPMVEKKGSGYSKFFQRLPGDEKSNMISTAVTGTVVGLIPLFGVLYKFTPMGQLLKSKIGILNNDISNNDEEYTKISLMEQESDHISSRQETYNIKYQTL